MRSGSGAVWVLALVLLLPGVAALPLAESPIAGAPAGVPGALAAAGNAVFVDPAVLETLGAKPVPVILVLDPARLDEARRQLDMVGIPSHFYSHLPLAAVLADVTSLPRIERVPGVQAVYANERMAPTLDRSVDYMGGEVVWDTYGVTGKGVTVLVVDSGVDGTHPDVQYRANLIENVVVTRENGGLVGGSREGVVASDPDGHGTHVTAIVGGTSKASAEFAPGKFRGVAPNARLIGYQAGITDPSSGEVSFESLTVLEAFNWALENRAKYNVRVVSNSWGANGDFDPRSPINIATLNLYKAGIVVVFAAGNEGDLGEHTLNKYSVAPWVLSVTAGDYFNNVPKFASRGTEPSDRGLPYDHPDLVAPGVGITSARARTNTIGIKSGNAESQFYSTKSGSSMAAPHVAGVVALLLEANPRLSPDDVMDVLTATATPMPRYEVWEAGAGYVNVLKAYQLARKATGHREEFLAGHVKYAGPASGDARYARDAVSVGYLKGAAHRLRSPDVSLGAFALALLTTLPGAAFLVGTAVIGGLAFGPGRRQATPALALLARDGLRLPAQAWRQMSSLSAGMGRPPRFMGPRAAPLASGFSTRPAPRPPVVAKGVPPATPRVPASAPRPLQASRAAAVSITRARPSAAWTRPPTSSLRSSR